MIKYTAPIAGTYVFTKSITTPTGRTQVVSNPERSWFQFWKPKTITIQETVTRTKQECVDLEKGQSISVNCGRTTR